MNRRNRKAFFAGINRFKKDADDGQNGGGGGGSEDQQTNWRDSLPDEIKTDTNISTIPDVQTLAKSYIDAQKHIGGSLRIPSEDAGKEDWDKFFTKVQTKVPTLVRSPDSDEAIADMFKKLGTPEAKDAYSVEGIKVEGITAEDGRLVKLREAAFDAGMTQKQFEKFATASLTESNNKAFEAETKIKESRDALKQEWGAAFDKKVADAIGLMEKTGAPANLIESAKKGTVGGETLKWAAAVAEAMGVEGNNMGDNGGSVIMTPAEAQSQIMEINRNREHPYWNNRDIGHQSAIAKMVELQKLAARVS